MNGELEDLWPDPDRRDAGLMRLLLRVHGSVSHQNGVGHKRERLAADAYIEPEDALRWTSVQRPPRSMALTEKELIVLRLASHGMESREIADLSGMAEETVKQHMKYILRKLACKTRGQAIAEGIRQGIIE